VLSVCKCGLMSSPLQGGHRCAHSLYRTTPLTPPFPDRFVSPLTRELRGGVIATSQVESVMVPGSPPEDRRPRCRRMVAEILLLRFGMVAPSITTNSASGVDWPSWAHLSEAGTRRAG
jgi:hypothetical protein